MVPKGIKLLDIILFLLMILFMYAAITKAAEHDLFRAQIGRSPLITRYAHILSWMVPISEFIIVMLLFVPSFRLVGLYASFSLMFAFTIYIAFVLTLGSNVPCSCGGILGKMGWTEHLIFNIVFTLLALFGIILGTKASKRKLLESTLNPKK